MGTAGRLPGGKLQQPLSRPPQLSCLKRIEAENFSASIFFEINFDFLFEIKLNFV